MKRTNIQTAILLFAVAFIPLLVSCDLSKKFEKEEASQIQSYLSDNSTLNFQLQPSGLYYYESKTGTGRTPITHDTAYVKYTGMFLNKETFDTNVGTTDTLVFPVNENILIPGLEEGVMLMKVGGKATLLIPSKLAWGPSGDNYYIPGYTPVLFDIELVKVKAGPGK